MHSIDKIRFRSPLLSFRHNLNGDKWAKIPSKRIQHNKVQCGKSQTTRHRCHLGRIQESKYRERCCTDHLQLSTVHGSLSSQSTGALTHSLVTALQASSVQASPSPQLRVDMALNLIDRRTGIEVASERQRQ